MPDWHELVRQRLGETSLPENDAAEVVEELADHLEETYHTSLGQGLTEQAALQRSLREVSSWRQLRSKIESSRKKELTVNQRTWQFWLPAFTTLFLSMVLLMAIQFAGPDPAAPDPLVLGSSHWRLIAPVVVVYGSWLFTLPFIGALGAYLSKRAGGNLKTVLSAVVFPVFPFLAFLVIGLPVALILDDHVAHNITLPAFLVGSSAWIVFPAIALLAGGLPVRYFTSRRPTARNVAGPCEEN